MRVGVGSRRRRPGKNIIIVVLFLLCVAAVGWYFLSERIVFTADGIKISFSDKKDEKEPTVPTEDITINITENESESEGETESESQTEDEPDEEVSVQLKARWITAANLKNTAYVDSLISQGVNQVVFTAKDTDGVVNIPFEFSAGNPNGLVSGDAQTVAENLKKLNDNGIYTIATISVMRDAIMTRSYRAEAMSVNSGETWLDSNNIPWFVPASQTAMNYTKELISALEALGVDEVMLTNFSYPTVGRTELIKAEYAPSQQVLTEAAKAFEDSSIPVGVLVSQNEKSGQNIAELEQYFDRMYVSGVYGGETAAALETSLSQKDKLVCVVGPESECSEGVSCVYTQ